MNTESLKTFLLVAEYKNVHRAAQLLFLTQSTVSTRIKNLEEELGLPLFDRSGKALSLTPAGSRLIPYAHTILNMTNDLHETLKEVDHEQTTLHIGVSNSLYQSHIKSFIPHFIMNNPGISLHFTNKNSLLMLEDLENDKLDICISFANTEFPDSKVFEIRGEQLVLVTGILDTPFIDGVTKEEFLSLPLYYSDFYRINKELSGWFQRTFPLNYHFQVQTDVIWDLIHLLQKSPGYAILPRNFVADELARHTLLEIPILFEVPPLLTSYVVVKKSHLAENKIQAFLSEIRSLFM